MTLNSQFRAVTSIALTSIAPLSAYLTALLPLGDSWLDALVIITLISSVTIGVIVRLTSFVGRLAKWFVVALSVGFAASVAIYRFGEPLAGVAYWLAVSTLSIALLPVAAILLIIAWRRNENRRAILLNFALIVMLSLLCVIGG